MDSPATVETLYALAWLPPACHHQLKDLRADQTSSTLKSIDTGRVIVEIFVFLDENLEVHSVQRLTPDLGHLRNYENVDLSELWEIWASERSLTQWRQILLLWLNQRKRKYAFAVTKAW
jgi:hypothetical protein